MIALAHEDADVTQIQRADPFPIILFEGSDDLRHVAACAGPDPLWVRWDGMRSRELFRAMRRQVTNRDLVVLAGDQIVDCDVSPHLDLTRNCQHACQHECCEQPANR